MAQELPANQKAAMDRRREQQRQASDSSAVLEVLRQMNEGPGLAGLVRPKSTAPSIPITPVDPEQIPGRVSVAMLRKMLGL